MLHPYEADFPMGVFQVWACEEVLQIVVCELKRHILRTLRLFQRNYYHDKVYDLMSRYTPHRLVELEFQLDNYQGCEEGLLYDKAKECIGDAIRAFYQKFCPEKVAQVEELLDKYLREDYVAHWEFLYQTIRKKYSPEGQ